MEKIDFIIIDLEKGVYQLKRVAQKQSQQFDFARESAYLGVRGTSWLTPAFPPLQSPFRTRLGQQARLEARRPLLRLDLPPLSPCRAWCVASIAFERVRPQLTSLCLSRPSSNCRRRSNRFARRPRRNPKSSSSSAPPRPKSSSFAPKSRSSPRPTSRSATPRRRRRLTSATSRRSTRSPRPRQSSALARRRSPRRRRPSCGACSMWDSSNGIWSPRARRGV